MVGSAFHTQHLVLKWRRFLQQTCQMIDCFQALFEEMVTQGILHESGIKKTIVGIDTMTANVREHLDIMGTFLE